MERHEQLTEEQERDTVRVSSPSQVVDINALIALLADIDAWLGNEDGLMIEDVEDWREQLAKGLGAKPRE